MSLPLEPAYKVISCFLSFAAFSHAACTAPYAAGLPPGVGGDVYGRGGGVGWKYRHMGYLSQLGGGVAVGVVIAHSVTLQSKHMLDDTQ